MRYIKHTAVDGERWDSLAYKYYGDALKAIVIINANPHLALTETLPAGREVIIPILSTVGVKTSQTLPPWLK